MIEIMRDESVSLFKHEKLNFFMLKENNDTCSSFLITKNTIDNYRKFNEFQNDNKKKVLSLLQHLKQEYAVTIPNALFEDVGYIPVESNFMDYLLYQYENCQFITQDSTYYININTDFRPSIINKPSEHLKKESSAIIRENIAILRNNNQYTLMESFLNYYTINFPLIKVVNMIKNNNPNIEYLKVIFKFNENILKFCNSGQIELLIQDQEKEFNLVLVKLLIKNKLKDPDMRLFKLICEKGDEEALAIYYQYLQETNYNKNISVHQFKKIINQIQFNQNITSIQSAMQKFRDIEPQCFPISKVAENVS